MEHPYHNDDNNNYNNEESTVGSRSFLGEGMDDRDPYYNEGSSMSISGQPLPRIFNAGIELESLLRAEMSGNPSILGFPPTCLPIARLLAGNHCCVDCGDEQYERLVYASLGYGSILCQECATRHSTVTPDESNIRHINNEKWDLRSTLTLLEGGNTKMLEYVKNKPRWRASRLMGQKNVDSEDVLAFKQIYLSKAAATYRTNLSKKVDQVHYEQISAMRDEDARKEGELEQMNTSPQADPFQRIFEMNNMTGDEIPGFGGGSMSQYNDDAGDNNFIGANSMAATAGGRRRRGARNTLSASKTLNGSKTAPSADLIKQRIAMRRGMSRRNQMAAFDEESQMGMSEAGYSNVGGGGRMGSKAVRRHSGIGNFVGEIKSIADPYEEASVAPSVARTTIKVHGRPLPQDQQDDNTSQVVSKYRGRRPSQEHSVGVAYRQSIANEPAVRESALIRLGNELATQGGRRLSIESGSQYGERNVGNGGQQERQMVGAAAYEATKYDQQSRRRLSNASGNDDGGNQQLVSSYTRGPVYRQPSITN